MVSEWSIVRAARSLVVCPVSHESDLITEISRTEDQTMTQIVRGQSRFYKTQIQEVLKHLRQNIWNFVRWDKSL